MSSNEDQFSIRWNNIITALLPAPFSNYTLISTSENSVENERRTWAAAAM